MRVVRPSVEEQVRAPEESKILGIWLRTRKYQPRRVRAASGGFPPQIHHGWITLDIRASTEQPKHRARYLGENGEPRAEHFRVDLVAAVETAKHYCIVRQAKILARRRSGDWSLPVVDLVACRQLYERLCIVRCVLERRHERITNKVIDVRRPHRARVAEIVDLNGRGTQPHDRGRRTNCVALQI